jgi:hypothetical protein
MKLKDLLDVQFFQGLKEAYPHLTEKEINNIIEKCRKEGRYVYGE